MGCADSPGKAAAVARENSSPNSVRRGGTQLSPFVLSMPQPSSQYDSLRVTSCGPGSTYRNRVGHEHTCNRHRRMLWSFNRGARCHIQLQPGPTGCHATGARLTYRPEVAIIYPWPAFATSGPPLKASPLVLLGLQAQCSLDAKKRPPRCLAARSLSMAPPPASGGAGRGRPRRRSPGAARAGPQPVPALRHGTQR